MLIHGDAAFAGQGVVAETLNLSGLAGYRTGGTVHIVINNQLGFTTAPEAARTSVYPTDVAKMVQAPIFHVNGDDPEACVRAARLAFGFRQAFHKDVVIDLVCYRRHGHNEGDDPSYTQPLMYALIEAKRSVRKLYTESLVRRGDITLEEAEQALDDFSDRLQAALDETRAESDRVAETTPVLPEYVVPDLSIPAVETGIDDGVLHRLAAAVQSVPEGFVVHPKLVRQFEQRDKVVADGEVDWALGEALALGSLLLEGTDVRLTGQDTRRGTFSHRHAVLVDHTTGAEHVPLAHLEGARAVHRPRLAPVRVRRRRLRVRLLGGRPDALVAWEAQFGDFWNGAEIIIDNFLVAAEDKWGQQSGLVLLLPHGYEGQGPEHSSARIERFLTLCARGNIRVTEPTTAAQYFHLLRAQVRLAVRRPLVVFTPKSLLRARQARSPDRRLHRRVVRRGARRPGPRHRGVRPGPGDPGGAVHRQDRLRRTGPARRAAARTVPRWPSSGSSSSTRGPTATIAEVLRRYPQRRRGGVAPGGAGEHGGVELRARPAAPAPARDPHPPPRQPGRVGQPGLGERRAPPPRAGRPAAPRRGLSDRQHPTADTFPWETHVTVL